VLPFLRTGGIDGSGALSALPRTASPAQARFLQRTIALAIGAVVLYFPANLLPVLQVESTLQGTRQSTIVGGVVQFWKAGITRGSHYFHCQRDDPILKFSRLLCSAWGRALAVRRAR